MVDARMYYGNAITCQSGSMLYRIKIYLIAEASTLFPQIFR